MREVRAIGLTEYGGPEVLRELSLPAEELGPNQVRVEVEAAAVSPADATRRVGALSRSSAPPGRGEVPGMDIAGVVIESGRGAPHDVGERVMGIVLPDGEHGGYRSDVVLPAASVTTIPSGTSATAAATLPMNGLTAMLALSELGLSSGERIAVTGAAGVLGGFVVQLAVARGLRVLADASAADEALVRSLGAEIVVRRGDDVATKILQHVSGGVSGLVDCSSHGALVLPAVRAGGTMITVRGWSPRYASDVRVTPIRVHTVANRSDWLEHLGSLVEMGALTLRIADQLPAVRAADAHRRLERGGVRGRQVLTF